MYRLVKLFKIFFYFYQKLGIHINQNTEKSFAKLGYLINFRFYIQFHIQAVKTYLHIKMNKKEKEMEKKLSSGKIISDDYTKNLETFNFHSTLKKNTDDMKLFSNEFNKINI